MVYTWMAVCSVRRRTCRYGLVSSAIISPDTAPMLSFSASRLNRDWAVERMPRSTDARLSTVVSTVRNLGSSTTSSGLTPISPSFFPRPTESWDTTDRADRASQRSRVPAALDASTISISVLSASFTTKLSWCIAHSIRFCIMLHSDRIQRHMTQLFIPNAPPTRRYLYASPRYAP